MQNFGFVEQFFMSWYTYHLHYMLKETIKHTLYYVNQDRYELLFWHEVS